MEIVGSIKSLPERPVFEIVGRDQTWTSRPEVRPCDHPGFILDAKWASVTCNACGERLDPFAVLMMSAEWSKRLEDQRQELEYAEKRVHLATLQKLSLDPDITGEEEVLIDNLRVARRSVTLEDARAAAEQIAAAVRERRVARKGTP